MIAPDNQAQSIRKLLKKQDFVIEQLDQLNARIEAALRAAAPANHSPDSSEPSQAAA